jgi:glucose/arabinose dehydrogenase
MVIRTIRLTVAALLLTSSAGAQSPSTPPGTSTSNSPAAAAQRTSNDPFPAPIVATEGVVRVSVTEYATIPEVAGQPARMMLLTGEPGGRRLFVNDMRGPLYVVNPSTQRSGQAASVALYLDINDAPWGVRVESGGSERGFQSFAFHPQFNQAGTPGFGKFYTYLDTPNMTPPADFTAAGAAKETHDTVLLEWTAKTPGAATYDGGPPRELIRIRQPFANHNAGHLAFNPNAAAGSPDFGLLYTGVADGGSGGDPLKLSQNLGSIFGKVLRINPLGTNSANKKYGIPAANPMLKTTGALPEIYAYGVRNPQRFAWDSRNGNMFLADIGQNIVEELSPVTAGANLGWNDWEGSYRFISRQAVDLDTPRSDPKVTYPIAEYGQLDPLLQGSSAATGVVVYRGSAIPQLANLILWGDNPSGEIFYVSADKLPNGGQDAIRRVLLNHNGATKTFLEVIKEKNAAQGKAPATRADLRFGTGPDSQVFLLNKRDGIVRLLVPDAPAR